VDRSEAIVRFLEAEVEGAGGKRRVLVPINFTLIDKRRGEVNVDALHGRHFAEVPGLRNPEQVTLLEEEKIMGYFGGGTLYADPSRQEPLL
jgi:photosynthetic reaction center H subunit